MSRRARRIWMIPVSMLLAGIAIAWITALAFPLWTRLGIRETTAARLPNFGFFIGLALGLGIGLSKSIKDMALGILGMATLGAVLWFFALVAEDLLIAMGIPESLLFWMPAAAFWGGIVLGALPIFAISHDKIGSLLARRGWKRKRA